ncbi:MAG: L-2-hydroxyglutarate oxidase, partial [Gaiellaceae bacterium]
MALGERSPEAHIVVLEKEQGWARHQSGRNSGVIHSGIYYKPGSFKARFARVGNAAMTEFCREHGIEHEICGKLIVATRAAELPRLESLYRRGLENSLDVKNLTPDEAREIEPHVDCIAAIRVSTTGIVDYGRVAAKYAELVEQQGGVLRLATTVERIHELRTGGYALETSSGDVHARWLVNCAGLFSDRIARAGGAEPEARIIPFRGEYYELRPEKRHLVNTLIYPVPNPDLPFLGVHLTRTIE